MNSPFSIKPFIKSLFFGNYASQSKQNRGFTLIEILAAVTVLALIMSIMAGMISMVSQSWQQGKARVDNFAKARLSLDRITRDIQAAILRPDLPYFSDQSGNDVVGGNPILAFYARNTNLTSAGTGGDRSVSVIFYETNNGSTLDLLEKGLRRGALGFNYGTPIPDFYNPSGTNPGISNVTSNSPGLNYQTIGPGVILMKVRLIQKNGIHVDFKNDCFDFNNPDAPENCHTAIITLAVLDQRSLEQLGSSNLTTLINRLESVADPTGTQTYKTTWENSINSGGFFTGLPMQYKGGLRIFERYVSLPFTSM